MNADNNVRLDRNLKRVMEIATTLINLHHAGLDDTLNKSINDLQIVLGQITWQMVEDVASEKTTRE